MTAYKKRTYSPNRIKYPLKRVDWDPNGERNPQNRGKSKYVRISWDEATDIIAGEIRRIQKTYGLNAILLQADGHGESKTIHTPHGHNGRLMDDMGGFTLQVRQPDSWEGWYWGSKHVWGQGFQGMMAPQLNVLKDIVEHCRPGAQVGLRRRDHSVGLHRAERHQLSATSSPRSASSRSTSAPS